MADSGSTIGGIFVGLGSNIAIGTASPFHILKNAIEACRSAGLGIAACSSFYRSAPQGVEGQPDYANAVIRILCDLQPRDLLARLHGIENEMGRVRRERWGPRTLDLDLLDMAGTILPDLLSWHREAGSDSAPSGLTLPHPRLHLRRFVLEPLLEIAPGWQHPVLLRSGADLLENLTDQGVVRVSGSPVTPDNLAP